VLCNTEELDDASGAILTQARTYALLNAHLEVVGLPERFYDGGEHTGVFLTQRLATLMGELPGVVERDRPTRLEDEVSQRYGVDAKVVWA